MTLHSFSGLDWFSPSQHEKVPRVVKLFLDTLQKSLHTNSIVKDANMSISCDIPKSVWSFDRCMLYLTRSVLAFLYTASACHPKNRSLNKS